MALDVINIVKKQKRKLKNFSWKMKFAQLGSNVNPLQAVTGLLDWHLLEITTKGFCNDIYQLHFCGHKASGNAFSKK
ncbi:unnamed protein product, partial [Dovyalis caffra]